MNTLKKLRDETGMTQEAVAEKLEVSVSTLQGWERTERIPKESLHDLLDVYGVDQKTRDKTVLQIFGERREEADEAAVDNFPYFLFEDWPAIIDKVKHTVLTEEEMEIFGYTVYLAKVNKKNDSPCMWPMDYSFIREYGGSFAVQQKIRHIKSIIGNYEEKNESYYHQNNDPFVDIIYQYGVENPDKGFSFMQMPVEFITDNLIRIPDISKDYDISGLYQLCKAVEKPIHVGTTDKSYLDEEDLPEEICDIIQDGSNRWRSDNKPEYTLNLSAIEKKCIELYKQESDKEDYLQLKEQYMSDRKAYEAHPNLYDHEPKFEFKYDYWVKLTDLGREYIKWYEK
ncbi:MAG: XRE family transcriptional regulator [Lachnospiraceae bacterium]|uniref:Helix-turn-helix domain-containing protein n=1 Tax=Candidatus Weimeria bifida TaxID=2599074 RepID=A0A6N7IWT6_9FIRM|nr:helix-turn-helix domain-containing protein [Candidatus Weimeria bifida]RRF95768.1 MAG: XRE family transcriptional regulator [Lachnospiraceae bacterium]